MVYIPLPPGSRIPYLAALPQAHPRLAPHEAHHDGPYGRITSSWKRKGRTVQYTLTIPPNSTATLQLPGKDAIAAGPGTHRYEVKE